MYITQDGLEKLEKELEQLKTTKMPEIIERIARAKELGDLSENAEYQEAKEDQAFTAGRIAELENAIRKAEIINNNGGHKEVNIGSSVKVKCAGREYEYTITGSNESDPTNGLISNESPMGRAFLGKKVGDKIKVVVPMGEMEYEVMAIK